MCLVNQWHHNILKIKRKASGEALPENKVSQIKEMYNNLSQKKKQAINIVN